MKKTQAPSTLAKRNSAQVQYTPTITGSSSTSRAPLNEADQNEDDDFDAFVGGDGDREEAEGGDGEDEEEEDDEEEEGEVEDDGEGVNPFNNGDFGDDGDVFDEEDRAFLDEIERNLAPQDEIKELFDNVFDKMKKEEAETLVSQQLFTLFCVCIHL